MALRLCHARILWADEDYHLAAAVETLHGKLLYRDLWYDKPPLAAWLYAAMAVWRDGRCAFSTRCTCSGLWSYLAIRRRFVGRREAMLAAGLMHFF